MKAHDFQNSNNRKSVWERSRFMSDNQHENDVINIISFRFVNIAFINIMYVWQNSLNINTFSLLLRTIENKLCFNAWMRKIKKIFFFFFFFRKRKNDRTNDLQLLPLIIYQSRHNNYFGSDRNTVKEKIYDDYIVYILITRF